MKSTSLQSPKLKNFRETTFSLIYHNLTTAQDLLILPSQYLCIFALLTIYVPITMVQEFIISPIYKLIRKTYKCSFNTNFSQLHKIMFITAKIVFLRNQYNHMSQINTSLIIPHFSRLEIKCFSIEKSRLSVIIPVKLFGQHTQYTPIIPDFLAFFKCNMNFYNWFFPLVVLSFCTAIEYNTYFFMAKTLSIIQCISVKILSLVLSALMAL